MADRLLNEKILAKYFTLEDNNSEFNWRDGKSDIDLPNKLKFSGSDDGDNEIYDEIGKWKFS